MVSETELIRLLGTRFVERRDVKAFQSNDGAWFPDKSPMTLQDFQDHLAGRKTMGHYMVDPATQNCKLFAFDIDLRKPKDDYQPIDGLANPYNPREAWLTESPLRDYLVTQLRTVADGFARRIHSLLGIPVAIANSGGKGIHVYGFTGSIPADAAYEMVNSIIESWRVFTPTRGQNFWRHTSEFPEIEIETFPKQSSVNEDGFGNLMSLPLGINRKTGQTKTFLTSRAELHKLSPMKADRALEGDLPWE